MVSKNRVPGPPVGKNTMILRSLVLTQYQRVTDRQTDGYGANIVYYGANAYRALTQLSATKVILHKFRPVQQRLLCTHHIAIP